MSGPLLAATCICLKLPPKASVICATKRSWQAVAQRTVAHAAGSTPGGSRPTWSAAGRAPPSSMQWWIGTLCATPSCTTQLCASGTANRAAMAPSATLGVALPSQAAAAGAPGSPKATRSQFRRQLWSRWERLTAASGGMPCPTRGWQDGVVAKHQSVLPCAAFSTLFDMWRAVSLLDICMKYTTGCLHSVSTALSSATASLDKHSLRTELLLTVLPLC